MEVASFQVDSEVKVRRPLPSNNNNYKGSDEPSRPQFDLTVATVGPRG